MNPKQRFKPGDRVTIPHTDSGVWTVVEFVTFDLRTKQNVYKVALPKTSATSYVKESEMRMYREKPRSVNKSVRDEITIRRREEDKNLGNYKIQHDMVGRAKRTFTNESPLKHVVRMLREQGNDDKPPQDEGGASLDAQVDKYLIDYESEAKNVQQEGKDFRRVTRRFLESRLNEEDEDVSSEQKSIDNIDIENFANSVVRLIENYDNLIEVRSTLFRRAKNYLAKMYDEEVISSFEEIMRDQHGIEAGKTPSEIKADEFQPPSAARAGDGSIGGAGG